MDVEDFRRETPSMSTAPLSREELATLDRAELPGFTGLLDYSAAGNRVSRGMQHLDESLPIGQRRRSELAFAMMEQGMVELKIWMRARGYHV